MNNQLNILPNDITQPPSTQFNSINYGLMSLNSWASNQGSNILVDYTLPTSQNIITKSTQAVAIPNFTFSPTVNNNNCDFRFSLSLQGNGQIILYVNGSPTNNYYFNNTGFQPLSINTYKQIKTGRNQIQLYWKAITGTITLANSNANPGNNTFQVISMS